MLKVAIATVLFSMEGRSMQCRLRVWCTHARRLNRDVFDGNASVVLVGQRSRDCSATGAVHIPHDARLRAYALNFSLTHKTSSKMSLTPRLHRNLFVKWQLLSLVAFDRVVFLDSDVDPYFGVEYRRDELSRASRHVSQLPSRTIYALSDHASPVNTGVLVLSPNKSLFELGMRVVRGNDFNTTHGFELGGPPRLTMKDASAIRHTACMRKNTWEFVGGDSDQGLFSYMAYARQELRVEVPRFLVGSHFWGGAKPFSSPSCASYRAHVERTLGARDSCSLGMRTGGGKSCFFNHRTHIL